VFARHHQVHRAKSTFLKVLQSWSQRRNVPFLAMPDDPDTALQKMRDRIHGGARLLLDSLSHALIREGEAEIINEACKPFVVRVLAS
jgi:hypothetical protein